MEYDKRYPKHLQVRDFISNSIAIGDFKGFSGRFSKDIIDRLKRCPLVQEITEDIMFNALDFEIKRMLRDIWPE